MVDPEKRIRLHANTDYCLVVDGDRFENGGKIQLWKCSLAPPSLEDASLAPKVNPPGLTDRCFVFPAWGSHEEMMCIYCISLILWNF